MAGARDVGVSPAIAGSLQNGGTDLVEVEFQKAAGVVGAELCTVDTMES